MGKLELTEEARKKRSENAKKLVAEGRLGGAQFGRLGGRPRKRRATEIAAEKIAAEGEELYRKLKAKIDSDSEKVSLEAIKFAYSLEEQERKAQEAEEIRYEQLARDELIAVVFKNLEALATSGVIDLGEIVDAEVIEDRTAIGVGEGVGTPDEAGEGYEGSED
jgi:hypothetical protein